jgi:phosphoribosylformimino-5-aminoimidazole carboxamide ribotide isomerase
MENKKAKYEFTIFPAIDLRNGKVVRLAQGDPKRETIYAADPSSTALRWQKEGASYLHVVNLDGAFGESTASNELALSRIISSGLKIQLGGGIRDLSGIQRALSSGISRVIIGTAAINNPSFIDVAMRNFGEEKIVIGIDARDGRVQIRGWAQATKLDAVDLGRKMYARGVRWCVFTDVERDGISSGLNIPATVELARETGLRVIASGGVASLVDVVNAAKAGLAGVIIGRAIYEGTFTLKEALDCVR